MKTTGKQRDLHKIEIVRTILKNNLQDDSSQLLLIIRDF